MGVGVMLESANKNERPTVHFYLRFQQQLFIEEEKKSEYSINVFFTQASLTRQIADTTRRSRSRWVRGEVGRGCQSIGHVSQNVG